MRADGIPVGSARALLLSTLLRRFPFTYPSVGSTARPLGKAADEPRRKDQCVFRKDVGLLPVGAGPSGNKPLAVFLKIGL